MKCNTSKCKEVCSVKKGCKETFPPIQGIEQLKERTVLGLTIQDNCKFSEHVKTKLREANKCLYIIRSLRKEGYTLSEVDHLFEQLVLPKFIYALPVYGASQSDLNVIQCFLTGCFKRQYTIEHLDIFKILEQCDERLSCKINSNSCHPLYQFLPKVKETSKKLRTQTSARPRVNTERFKNCVFSRLVFKHNLARN